MDAEMGVPTGTNNSAISVRTPTGLGGASGATFVAPSIEFLQGLWYASHSTMSMWKSNQNITITYTPLSSPPGAIDDLMQYNVIGSDKQKSVHGVDVPDSKFQGKYTWRGKGWMKVWSTEWEVLSFGEEEGGWILTYFLKSMFTAAGVHIYARAKTGISASLLNTIKAEMKKIDNSDFSGLTEQIFEVHHGSG